MKSLSKKSLVLLMILVIFITGSLYVKAASSSSLEGNIVASPGDEIKYTIRINSDKHISIVEAALSYDTRVLELKSINNKTFSGNNSIKSKDLVFFSKGITGTTDVAELVFKVNANTSERAVSIELNPINFCENDAELSAAPSNKNDCDGIKHTVTAIKKSVSIKSNINTLKSVKINGKAVEGFSSNKFEYSFAVEASVDSAKIDAVLSDTKATFKTSFGNRTEELEYGPNDIKLKVVSEFGKEQVYSFEINREDNRGTNNYLDSIIFNGNKIRNFKSKTLSYTVYAYKAEDIKLEAETSDDKADYEVIKPDKLIIGDNKYQIVVSSESGEELIYNITVVNVDRDISKKIKTLSIQGYKIDFDKNSNRYEILYDKIKMSKLKLYFQTEESEDFVSVSIKPDVNNIKGESSKLRPGDEIVITVEGIDGESQDYTIVIKKDTRISFFLIIGILLLAILGFIFIKLKKSIKEEKTAGAKHAAKDKKSKRGKDKDEDIEYEEKPKKKRRFSIYEDEYEEVEIVDTKELDIPSGIEKTKEFSRDELRKRSRH